MVRVRLRDTQETVEDFQVDRLNSNPSRHSFAHPGRRKSQRVVGDGHTRQGARVASGAADYLDEDLRLGELEIRRGSTVPVLFRLIRHTEIVGEERLGRLRESDVDLLDTAREWNSEGEEGRGT